jgi:hypothetical protein
MHPTANQVGCHHQLGRSAVSSRRVMPGVRNRLKPQPDGSEACFVLRPEAA